MKPSKKKPAKRTTAKRAVRRGSIEHKLMKLHNRIDEAMTSEPKHIDLQWVWEKVEFIQKGLCTKLGKGHMKRCNDLWRQYA